MDEACHVSPCGRTVRGELIYSGLSISQPSVCLGLPFPPVSTGVGPAQRSAASGRVLGSAAQTLGLLTSEARPACPVARSRRASAFLWPLQTWRGVGHSSV